MSVSINGQTMNLKQHRYDITGGLRLDLEDAQGFPYCVVTHNIPERPLPEGEVWAKLHDGQADIVMQLIAAGVLLSLDETIAQGWVTHYALRCRFLHPIAVAPIPADQLRTLEQLQQERGNFWASLPDWVAVALSTPDAS